MSDLVLTYFGTFAARRWTVSVPEHKGRRTRFISCQDGEFNWHASFSTMQPQVRGRLRKAAHMLIRYLELWSMGKAVTAQQGAYAVNA